MFISIAMRATESPATPVPDVNRAAGLYTFTWILCSLSIISVSLRMYTRARLLKNLWWDDWFIVISFLFTITFSIMWTVYGARGYARHAIYLNPLQKSDAAKLGIISRACCVVAIATGKISVAFLIQRIQASSKWRTWFLRFCSISVGLLAFLVVVFLFAQCQPVHTLWTPSMIKDGTGHCWDPIPGNNYNIAIASYFAWLDFVLAIVPASIVWKLQMAMRKKLALCALLGMGVFAGICATIKTAHLRSTTQKEDMTWKLPAYLLWNALEVNIIIIAACIPTLRPLFLVVFQRPGATAFLKKSYQMTPRTNTGTRGTNGSRKRQSRPIDDTESQKSINGDGKEIPLVEVTEFDGKDSGSVSTDGNTAWDGEAQLQTMVGSSKRQSGNNIPQTTELTITTHDGSERNMRHMV
ncbi:MAG: hypothetical protein L6R38_003979 [Xanthoria sp. 2 TBL-2021]|nr:MAG: hypothetical protein L6R38_003979 [Xanthoria sp. 2 TBL-2021]